MKGSEAQMGLQMMQRDTSIQNENFQCCGLADANRGVSWVLLVISCGPDTINLKWVGFTQMLNVLVDVAVSLFWIIDEIHM